MFIRCKNCNSPEADTSNFCSFCGTSLKKTEENITPCSTCKIPELGIGKYCSKCGNQVDKEAYLKGKISKTNKVLSNISLGISVFFGLSCLAIFLTGGDSPALWNLTPNSIYLILITTGLVSYLSSIVFKKENSKNLEIVDIKNINIAKMTTGLFFLLAIISASLLISGLIAVKICNPEIIKSTNPTGAIIFIIALIITLWIEGHIAKEN